MGLLSKVVSPFASQVGDIFNDVTGVSSSMKAQNDYNTAMWNAQNEYNSPTAQLARMREAGIDINPTSYALGTGNLSNTASHVTSGAGSPAGNPISMLMGMAQGVQGIRESKQRTDNMKEQGINIMTEGNNLLTRGTGLKIQNESGRLNNEIARHNLAYGRKVGRPVGYVPSLHSAPYEYAKGLGEQIFNDF